MTDTKETQANANLERGKLLRQRMVWTAIKPSEVPNTDAKVAAATTDSERVAERYAALDKSLLEKIDTCDEARKDFRKFAEETLGTEDLRLTLQRWAALLVPEKDESGADYKAFFKSPFVEIAVVQSEATRSTVESMLDILVRATDEDLLEESAKKARGNGQPKKLADSSARKYGKGYEIQGGNEHTEGEAYSSFLLYDRTGAMRTVTRLAAKCARALDQGNDNAAGEIYGVLTGDLPARKDEHGKPTLVLTLSPNIADTLVQGRLYHRIADALKTKIQKLKEELTKGKNAEKSEAYEKLESEVISESNKRIIAAKDAEKAANVKDVNPVVPAVTSHEESIEAQLKAIKAEWKAEQDKGNKASQKKLTVLAEKAALFHPDFAATVKQFEKSEITEEKLHVLKGEYGRKMINGDAK